jgi:hypothetical protein
MVSKVWMQRATPLMLRTAINGKFTPNQTMRFSGEFSSI